MDQSGIIRDLLVWLESHLDHPLSLDNVAAKAGYSKWHLQRMFKEVTGHAMRVQFWREFLANCPTIPPVFYGLNESRPSVEKDDEQEVFYTTALPEPLAEGCVEHAHPVTLEGGDYVQFTYEGPGTGVQEFILTVYGTCMPALGLTRRRGQDIERYLLTEASGAQEGDINLRCEYLIPIRR